MALDAATRPDSHASGDRGSGSSSPHPGQECPGQRASILCETAECREVHQLACLLGYGASGGQSLCGVLRPSNGPAHPRSKLAIEALTITEPAAAGQELPFRAGKGPAQDHVQDGHLHAGQLQRRTDVPGHRAFIPDVISTLPSPTPAPRSKVMGFARDRRRKHWHVMPARFGDTEAALTDEGYFRIRPVAPKARIARLDPAGAPKLPYLSWGSRVSTRRASGTITRSSSPRWRMPPRSRLRQILSSERKARQSRSRKSNPSRTSGAASPRPACRSAHFPPRPMRLSPSR